MGVTRMDNGNDDGHEAPLASSILSTIGIRTNHTLIAEGEALISFNHHDSPTRRNYQSQNLHVHVLWQSS